ncbi:NUDIX domain-containing protein [Schaalia sp. 19OD2882]|uniref:NUDIX hydrolase n=1 Tax=Schaalia sp. 19OD2882 TaxID=2794089 RepID=UPI001C1EA637|nr:NUDIX domain-containing protein [Schaalia sp. 19OD2882]QWW19348.1 NUDIX domain-containing protein [Schaalia sp. 19OD2882]
MSTPQFILDLREHIGHAPLWLPGATAIVLRPAGARGIRLEGEALASTDEDDATPSWTLPDGPIDPTRVEVLVVRRTDNGAWTPVTGIVDPGEPPFVAAERETLEEAGVRARAVRLLSQDVVGPVVYPNGDRSDFVDSCFLLQWVQGEPWPADGENTQTLFVRADQVPPMNERFLGCLQRALSGRPEAAFRF